MKAPPAVKPPNRLDPTRRAVVHGCAMLALVALPAFARPDGRMDPSERQRLRHELREQSIDERMRLREERMRAQPRPGNPGPPPGRRDEPGVAPGPGSAPPPAGYPHPRDPRSAPEGRQRMSPQEREELRMMLRERHRGRD